MNNNSLKLDRQINITILSENKTTNQKYENSLEKEYEDFLN